MLTSIQFSNHSFTVSYFKRHFILLKDKHAMGLAVIGKAILEQQFPFIDEVIAAEKEIYLKLNSHYREGDLALLTKIKASKKIQERRIKLPVCFEVEGDWAEVEAISGFAKTVYLQKLLKRTFTIAMFGFMPGFVYLHGLTKALQVPRKATPARHMPPNSLALGGPYLGIYSLASPAGWQQIGVLPFSLLSWEELPPLLLTAADRIQLEAISQEEYQAIQKSKLTFFDYNGIISSSDH